MDLEGQPAQPSSPGRELQEETERGHSQEESPRRSEARAANGATDPGLQLGPPSVRKGSGESYPDPSETERKEKKNDKTSELRETHADRYKDKMISKKERKKNKE